MILLKQVLQAPKQVSYLYANRYKRYDNIPCPVCKNVRCYDHCNNCGISIDIRKDEYGKYRCYLDGTDIIHTRKNGCMGNGTADGNFKDVNLKREIQPFTLFDTGNFYQDNVVREKENNITKQAKIDLYNKLTGYGLAERLKQKDLSYVKEWEKHTFEY